MTSEIPIQINDDTKVSETNCPTSMIMALINLDYLNKDKLEEAVGNLDFEVDLSECFSAGARKLYVNYMLNADCTIGDLVNVHESRRKHDPTPLKVDLVTV